MYNLPLNCLGLLLAMGNLRGDITTGEDPPTNTNNVCVTQMNAGEYDCSVVRWKPFNFSTNLDNDHPFFKHLFISKHLQCKN